jgi:WD repeat-containing protein 55
LKIDENTVITGSEDGYIRGVSVGPNKVLNYLGNHADGDDVEPVCKMSLSYDKKFVATISHDNWVKFHNISGFVEGRKIAEVDRDDDDDDKDDEEKWDDSDVEDFEDRKKMPKKPNILDRKKEIELEKKKNFFSDM